MSVDEPTPVPSGQSKLPTVARAGGIMMASLLLSRLLGLLRDTVMVAKFGIAFDTDAYRLAVTIPDTIFFLIAGGGLSSAFIPVFSEFLHKDKERDAWRVFSVVTTLSAIIVTALIGVAWVFAPQIAAFMADGKTHTLADGSKVPLNAHDIDQIILMSRIMLPAQFSFMVGSVLLATLYARRRFVAPGVAPNIYNVGIIAGAFVGPTLGIGIAGMSWGALIGAAIGNLLLPILVMLRLGGHFTPSIDLKTPGVDKFFKLLLPVILGFSLPSVAALITQKFASYYGETVNTVMTLSNNLMQAPLGIFGQALALAAFPVLAQFYATNRMDMYRDQISKTLRTVLYLAIPSSLFLFALAPEIVQVIYGYGRANVSNGVEKIWMGPSMPVELAHVVVALRWYTVGIFAWCIQPVLMRGFFSIHQTLRPVLIGTAMTGLFILMCWGLLSSSMGYISLPISSNVAALLLAVLLWRGLEKQIGGKLDFTGSLVVICKSLLASFVMGLLGWAVFQVVPHTIRKLPFVLLFLFVMCLCGWSYFFITKALKMPESDYLGRAINRMDRRKRPISIAEADDEAG
jgi:putative peptidoglycan lipid II flippase